MQKPSNAKGTRDFGPEVLQARKAILNRITEVFEKYAFQEIQTPALENLITLTGKYGNEGDKLLFKVLNSGALSHKLDKQAVDNQDEVALVQSLSEKGLRYDLTVPFARFVAQHRNDLSFPFRRYQVQEVWRADRPQKGRYREFTQCDADIIGSTSLLNEADLVSIYNEVFSKLGLENAVLRINHRKFLEAMVASLELPIEANAFTQSLDKLDKIGQDGVEAELIDRGLSAQQCTQLFYWIASKPLNKSALESIATSLDHPLADEACKELLQLIEYSNESWNINVQLDLSLARGLDYYTGCIFEAIVPDSGIGSVSGGGRYDNLTEVFGLADMSGVGISFGIDRLYDVLQALGKLNAVKNQDNLLVLCHFDESSRKHANVLAKRLRAKGIACLVYPDIKKLKKQLDFANKRSASHIVLIGDQEIEKQLYALKDMKSGEQEELDLEHLIAKLS